MNGNDEKELDDLFRSYREACPDIDASPNFVPDVWNKIESRQSFWFVFQRFAGAATTAASAALCVLLLLLNLIYSSQARPVALTYTDALMADQTAEKTYYAEAIRDGSSDDEAGAKPIGQPK